MTKAMALAGALLLGSGALVACTSDDTSDATPVAEALAKGLTARDLGDVPLEGDSAAYDALVAGIDAPAAVEVTSVERDGDEATVELAWTWELGGEPWNYTTEATLVEDSDDWVVRWAPSLVEPSLVAGETLDLTTSRPRRGEVIGRDADLIVTQRDVVLVGLDKAKIKKSQTRGSAKRIAQLLDITPGPYVKRAVAAGEKAFIEAIVLRAEDAEDRVPAAFDDVPGAELIGTTRPLAPTKEFAAPLLGSVGEATAELIEESDGALSAGDVVGLSGLQARYDDSLRGVPGVRVTADQGEQERVLHESDPTDGEPLELTLDVPLQELAERILADVGPASALVAIDPETGALLAAASGPGGKGQNTATYGRYAPGSTMKVVTALALLRSGLEPGSMVDCPATTVVDGKTFKNYDDYPASSLGRITLREAIAQSCNTALVGLADELDDDALAEAAAALGLGVDHDLGFPAYFGQVPPPEGKTEKAADLIGQGKVLASPLAMATVAASVRAGHTVVPSLIEGHEIEQVEPAVPLTTAEAKALRGLMRAVVTDGPGAFSAGWAMTWARRRAPPNTARPVPMVSCRPMCG
jgi:cell division protein FtsI/penicillin-binding protein 2